MPLGDVASCEWPEDCRRRRALAARWAALLLLATWPVVIGRRTDAGLKVGGFDAAGDVARCGWPGG